MALGIDFSEKMILKANKNNKHKNKIFNFRYEQYC